MGDGRTFIKREHDSNKVLDISSNFKMSRFYFINFIINLSYSTRINLIESDCNTTKYTHKIYPFEQKVEN